jgi:hypothetical protein
MEKGILEEDQGKENLHLREARLLHAMPPTQVAQLPIDPAPK